jgi:hypothetical protein
VINAQVIKTNKMLSPRLSSGYNNIFVLGAKAGLALMRIASTGCRFKSVAYC